jgi:hypothetical protein
LIDKYLSKSQKDEEEYEVVEEEITPISILNGKVGDTI